MNTVLVVGAGFSGAVVARELADAGIPVLVIDKRDHIGGNAHDRPDAHGVMVHPYGPHIFHTNAERIFRYLSRFTRWRPYEHRVLASVEGKLVPLPINIDTVNRLYGLELDETSIQDFFERVREPRDPVETSEDVVVNAVGRDLYEKFFRGYTRKQWGLDPSELAASVAARIPTRTNRDDRYFTDRYQSMPAEGYTRMFERVLDHPRISVETGVDYFRQRGQLRPRHTVYTGPVDAYFGHCFGHLPYRSLRFEHEHLPDTGRFQPVGTVNYPNDHAYTRITEFRHLTGQEHGGTSIVPRAHLVHASAGVPGGIQQPAALAGLGPAVRHGGRRPSPVELAPALLRRARGRGAVVRRQFLLAGPHRYQPLRHQQPLPR